MSSVQNDRNWEFFKKSSEKFEITFLLQDRNNGTFNILQEFKIFLQKKIK